VPDEVIIYLREGSALRLRRSTRTSGTRCLLAARQGVRELEASAADARAGAQGDGENLSDDALLLRYIVRAEDIGAM